MGWPRRTLIQAAVFVMLFSGLVSAQNRHSGLPFVHYTTENGLTHYSINGIVQDRSGFMWLATQNGLNRFDGYSFKKYRNDPSDSTSLSYNYVNTLKADSRGGLWIGTFGGGLNEYDPKTDRFVRYRAHPARATALSNDNVSAILVARTGDVWVGTDAGLNRFDVRQRRFFRIPALRDSSLTPRDSIFALCEDRAGYVWVGTNRGLSRLHPKTFQSGYAEDGVKQGHFRWPYRQIRALFADRNNTLWVGTERNGMMRIDIRTGKEIPLPFSTIERDELVHAIVQDLTSDEQGIVYIGTRYGGVKQWDPLRQTLSHLQYDERDPLSLSDNSVRSVYIDRGRNLWVGTLRGLNRYGTSRYKFPETTGPVEPGDPLNGWVQALHLGRNGEMWIGRLSGELIRYDPASRKYRTYRHRAGDPGSLSDGEIWSIAEDRSGAIWVGLLDRGLDRLDPVSGNVKHYRHDPNDPSSLSNDQVIHVYEDRTGTVWVSTFDGGLNRYDRRSDRFFRYQHGAGQARSLSFNRVWPVFQDRHGILWIGTFGGGLNRFDPDGNSFFTYGNRYGNGPRLTSDLIVHLAEDASGNLWIGTFDRGLNRLDPGRKSVKTYGASNGLNASVTSCIIPDGRQNLWISTDNGLFKFDPAAERFSQFDVSDGLKGNIFIIGACARFSDGRLVFGGEKGLTIFDPETIHDNPYIPPVVITDFKLFNESYSLEASIAATRRINLAYDQNFISFEFAALDYTDPEKNQYRYRLEGVDEQWVEAGNRRFASYPKLAPGKYRFVVTGSNNDGVWNTNGASIEVNIKPPFWETPLFYLLLAGTTIGVVAAAIRYRVKRLLEMERMRMRIARNLHDDVGANLSSMAIKSEILLLAGGTDEKTRRYVTEINRSAQETAHTLREIVWMVNAEYDTLEKLISKMEDLTASMLEGYVTYTFARPDHLEMQRLSMDFRQNVYFLYKEALHNVLKHAGARHVDIVIQVIDHVLILDVRDDGKGFDPDQVDGGNGLASMRSRSESIKGQFSLTSLPGKGTHVVLRARLNERRF